MLASKNTFVILICTIFFFSACSTKTEHGEFNKEFKEYTDKSFKKTTTKDYVKESIEEIIDDSKTLNLDNTKKISSLLEDLGEIDGKTYMLASGSEDIFIRPTRNSYKLGIKSFEKLNEYLQDTSNQFIYVKKNRFLKNRVKIVSVRNKDKIEENLKRIPFTVEGKLAVAEILEEVRSVSGFNIIAKKPVSEEEEKTDKTINEKLFSEDSLDDLFDNTFISFSGNNIMELLDYISIAFNIYVDIDYEKKTIIFEKLKSKIFNITLNNIDYDGSLDVTKDIENDVGSGSSEENSVKTTIKLEIMDSLEENLNAILDSSNIPGRVLSFNKTVGSIFVIADKKTMGEVARQIKIFNEVFDKQINFKLEVFEFALSKEFEAGVSLGATIDTATYSGKLATQTLATSIFDITRKTGSNDHSKSINGVNLNNKTVRLLKQTRHGYILKNSIPYFIDVTDSQSYIKSITTTTTTTDGISNTESVPEVSEINEGTILSVLAKVNGNKIEFNLQPKIIRVNSVDTVTFDEKSISLPDLSVNTFSSNVILKNGERKIIGYLTSYEDAKEYDGILPIEDFILGGASSKKHFRKETVFVISADIR